MHCVIETCFCVQLIGDLLFDAKGINKYMNEEEQEIYLYHNGASVNCIFHETALKNPMHCITKIFIIKHLYIDAYKWSFYTTMALRKNIDIPFFNNSLCILQDIFVT